MYSVTNSRTLPLGIALMLLITICFVQCRVDLLTNALPLGDPANETPADETAATTEDTTLILRDFQAAVGQTLTMNLESGGNVSIDGWTEERVSVSILFENCSSNDVDFVFIESQSGIHVNSEFINQVNNANITIGIFLPETFNIQMTSAGGAVDIRNIEGTISGVTGGGELNFSNLKGEIQFATGGGSIVLKDSEVDGRVITGGGPVLIENVIGDIEGLSGGGNVQYVNVITPTKTYPPGLVYIRSAGGAIYVEDAPAGADVETGGGAVTIVSAGQFARAVTGGGPISIGTVDGWVYARTGGGSIQIDAANGSIEAITGAGDVTAKMVGDPAERKRDVSIVSGTGDIALTLPDGLSMEVFIELAFTNDSDMNYELLSDLGIDIVETDVWDLSRGTPRKYIYGRGTIGDGRHKISIRTVNGDVRFLKGN